MWVVISLLCERFQLLMEDLYKESGNKELERDRKR